MAFDPYAPVSDTNPLPVLETAAGGAFVIYAPVSDTNPLPTTVTFP